MQPRTSTGRLLTAALLNQLDSREAIAEFVNIERLADLPERGCDGSVGEELKPHMIESLPVFWLMFGILVRRRFALGQDVRDITRYVRAAGERGTLGLHIGQVRQAEAMVRSVLGEPYAADGIPSDEAGVVVSCLIFDLVRCMDLMPSDIEAIVVEAESAWVDRA